MERAKYDVQRFQKELKDVQTVTVAAGESQVVYFAKQKLNTDENIILQAELSQKDSLTADNVQQVLLEKNTEQKMMKLFSVSY
mgnify:CR=1 FL=1